MLYSIPIYTEINIITCVLCAVYILCIYNYTVCNSNNNTYINIHINLYMN